MPLKINKRRKKTTAKRGQTSAQVKTSFKGGMRIFVVAFVFGAGLFILTLGVEQIGTLPVFKVKEIQWIGLKHLTEKKMEEGFQSVLGKNLFEVDIAVIQERLLAHQWIKEATVKKRFPNRILIVVVERKPASVEYEKGTLMGEKVDFSTAPYLVDQEGITLQQGGPFPARLPRLININPDNYDDGLALGTLAQNRPGVFIDLSDPKNLQVYFITPEEKRQTGLLHLGADRHAEKWRQFLEIEIDLAERGLSSWELDLRISGMAVLKSFEAGRSANTLYF